MDRGSGSDSPVATIEGRRTAATPDLPLSFPPAFSSQWAESPSYACFLYSLFRRNTFGGKLGMLDSGRLAGGLAGVAAAAAVADVHAAGVVVVVVVAAVRGLPLRRRLVLLRLLLRLKVVKRGQTISIDVFIIS